MMMGPNNSNLWIFSQLGEGHSDMPVRIDVEQTLVRPKKPRRQETVT